MSVDLDYYQALEVDKNADGETVKKSYRRLAMKYHPDKNPGNKEAEEKFKYICEAYECLKDEQKRAAYDRYGHSAFKQRANGMGGGNPFGFDFDFGAGGFSDIFSDIFSEFMGGGSRQSSNGSRRGDDLQYSVKLTLEEAFAGVDKEINIARTKECKKCKGFGTKDGKEAPICSNCRGKGRVRVQRGIFIMEDACPECHGEGRIIKDVCPECHGNGHIKKHEDIKVNIPAGIEDGSRVRLSGAGNAGLRGGSTGDLYILVSIAQHKIYEREGANLYAEIPISMVNAALGTKVEIPGVDGEKLEVEINSGSQYGSHIKLKNKGMPFLRSDKRGDLLIQLRVDVPKKLNERQKEILEEFRNISEDESSKSFLDKVKDLFSKVS
ncbi:MAG: molecular chaperone DnaJ [Lactobacillaceae bacterium]|jgi:molecular chaperone DnaJ|nr:molecular chaperone DnaJ [Lactobacillaceae bacterium]